MDRDSGASHALCKECESLLTEVVSAIRRTRILLFEPWRAAQAGLIDDLDFLVKPGAMEAAFDERQHAREAYLRHRANWHS